MNAIGVIGGGAAIAYALERRGPGGLLAKGKDPGMVVLAVRDPWWVAGLDQLRLAFGTPTGEASSWAAIAIKTRERTRNQFMENPRNEVYPWGQTNGAIAQMLNTWGSVATSAGLYTLHTVADSELTAAWTGLMSARTLIGPIDGPRALTMATADDSIVAWRAIFALAVAADDRGLHDTGVPAPTPTLGGSLRKNIVNAPEVFAGWVGDAASGVAGAAAGIATDAAWAVAKKLAPAAAFVFLAFVGYKVIT